MKIIVESHLYAPELNKVHLHDNSGNYRATMRAPGIKTIQEARKRLFRPVTPHRVANVEKQYFGEHAPYSRCYNGRIASYGDAVRFLNDLRQRAMPHAEIRCKTWLVG
jgi:hypothetical protein